MVETKNFHFKEFNNLDNSEDADFLIASMDVMTSIESVRQIKQRAIASLNLQQGDTVLEAGCGHGEDAEEMAKLVGEQGYVVAIDNSNRMLAEAKRRSTQQNVEYRLEEAQKISCNDGIFSACHADRLFVGHKNFEDMFTEFLRILKSNGRISITDVDALSIVIHPYGKTTEAILKELHRCFVNPSIGRMLLQLFYKYHLTDIELIPEILTLRSYHTLKKIFKFNEIMDAAIQKKQITESEAKAWEDNMIEAEEKNYFLYSIMLFTVAGKKS